MADVYILLPSMEATPLGFRMQPLVSSSDGLCLQMMVTNKQHCPQSDAFKGQIGLVYLKDIPVSFPLSSGRTLPTALAAPVEEGMMLPPAARPPLQSFLLGPS